MRPLMRLLPYLSAMVPTLLLAYACMVVLALSSAALAFLSGPAVGLMFSQSSEAVSQAAEPLHKALAWLPAGWATWLQQQTQQSALWLLPVLIVINSSVKGLAQAGQFALFGRVSVVVQRSLREDAYNALLRQTPQFYHRHVHGDLLSRLSHDCTLVEQALFYGLGSVLRDTLAVAALLGFCLTTQPKLLGLMVVVLPLCLAPMVLFGRTLKKVSTENQSAQGSLTQMAHETLLGLQVVQGCQQEPQCASKYAAKADQMVKQMTRSYVVRAVRTPVMEILGSLMVAGLLVSVAKGVQGNTLHAPQMLSLIAALTLMYDPIKKLGQVSDYLMAGAAAMERLTSLIDAKPTVVDPPRGKMLVSGPRAVTFERVRFSYQHRQVLCDVHFDMQPGKLTALVGPSGAGKTTVARLLMRFWDVSGGGILIDGVDLRELRLQHLRQQISHVGQDVFLFDTTIAQNIAFGRPHASRMAIERAAALAHANDFIEALPQGYDTPIGERGARLSGGQRQRLAIARALLRDTPILILDEATSNLDAHSEQAVRAGLDTLMAGRTSLVIAHRLSTVQHAQQILFMDQGTIVERGSHEDLMAQQGFYARHTGTMARQSAKGSREPKALAAQV